MNHHLIYKSLTIRAALAALALFGWAGMAQAAPPPVTTGTLTVWLDATDVNGNGSTPANGAGVTTWVNKAGGVGNFTSAGGSVDPAYVAASAVFNGQAVIRFTASTGRRLQNTANFGNAVTVIYVGRKSGGPSGRLVSSVANNWLLGYWTTKMNSSYWNSVGNFMGTATADNVPYIWAGTANGASFFVYRASTGGETQVDTGALGQGPNGLSLGGSSTEVGGGDIAELLVYNAALSLADRQSVENYLAAKWIPTVPVVDTAPQSFTAYVGEFAQPLSVTAAGVAPLAYQWLKGGVIIPGATTASLAINNALTTSDAGGYSVVISNSFGSVTSAVATVTVLSPTSITNGLAAYWAFDEVSGATASDSTTNANHGALVNFPGDNSQWIAGRIGGGLGFRGAGPNDYVNVPNYPKPGSTMTISAWVWADSRPTWATIIKNWPGSQQQFHFGLENTSGDLSNYLIQQGGGQLGPVREGAGSPIPLGSWQHVALVCDGRNMRLYRNGVPVGAPLAYNGTIQTNPVNQYLSIGAKRNGATVDSYWQGRMDDLGLWTRGLTADEIFSIYKTGTNGQPLTVAPLGNPALVTTQPQGYTKYEGEFGPLLSASVAGTAPLSIQWQKDGADIPGATSTTLNLGRLTNGSGGTYTMIATNLFGGATSAPATVVVLPVATMADGLIGYWNFDEGTGALLIDNSGYGDDGTLVNFPTDDTQWIAGRIGGALNFRGAGVGGNDYVVVPDYPKPNATMSITAWVWAEARPQWATIIKNWPGSGQQFHFGLNNVEGDLSNYLVQQGGAVLGPVREGTGTPLPIGSWQHVALVCDGQNQRLYRNGFPVGTPLAYNGTISTNLTLTALGIGAKILSPGVADSFWQGKMDDLGLWGRGLTADEILAIYIAGLNGAPLTDAVVGAQPPIIAAPPAGFTRYVGESASMFIGAAGTPPLSYQWRRNGVNVPGANDTTLSFSNLTAANAGSYDVVVSGPGGSATSAPPAVVTVLAVPNISTALGGYWNFDEGAGSILVDQSGNGNDGALMNYPDNTSWMPGQIGGALSFGGPASSQYILVPNYPKPSSTMTVSAWVTAEARPVWASIVKNWTGGIGGSFHFGLTAGDGDLSNYLWSQGNNIQGPAREGALFPLSTWQHVAFTADGTMLRLYRNGVEVAAVPYDGTIRNPPPNIPLSIGAKLNDAGTAPDGGAPGFWQGKMDDIGLWTRGLAPAEIRAIYTAGLSGCPLPNADISATPPVITIQPQSQTNECGGSVTLSVSATGTTPFKYQWFLGAAAIAGATADSIAINPASLASSGNYSVVVRGPGGAVTSAVAIVTILDTTRPGITCPAGFTFVTTNATGDNVSFTVTATDTCEGSIVPVCVPAPDQCSRRARTW